MHSHKNILRRFLPLSLFATDATFRNAYIFQKIGVSQWLRRLDWNQRPKVPKIVPERFIDSQELHKPCILDCIPFMLCMGKRQLHGHVSQLSYLLGENVISCKIK